MKKGATHVGITVNKLKRGFTLAEVLITLSIIGVVAALTIPELVKNMNDYAFGKSREVTLAKITEATNQMKSNDVLDGYATTAAFADEFQKYLKVANRCTSANLTDCFAPNFTSPGGKSITTTTLTTGDKLGQSTYTSSTVAFGLANGTTILFAFNPACTRIDPTDNQSNTTACLSMLYDINGSSKPNKIGKDIGAVNAEFDCIQISGICVATSDTTYSPISEGPSYTSNNNYWAGARDACLAQGMRLPTITELTTMYTNKASIGGFINNSIYWSSTAGSNANMAWVRDFPASGSAQNENAKNNTNFRTRCIK